MASNILSHFYVLDELIQSIYQGKDKFVVLSKANDDSWTVHVGLLGEEGRWWRGSWLEGDVLRQAGSESSEEWAEAFAKRLRDLFVDAHLSVENLSDVKGKPMSLNLGSSETSGPHRVPLRELTPEEAASYAANEFFTIANLAKSRNSRLNPSPFEISTVSLPTSRVTSKPLRTTAETPVAGGSSLKRSFSSTTSESHRETPKSSSIIAETHAAGSSSLRKSSSSRRGMSSRETDTDETETSFRKKSGKSLRASRSSFCFWSSPSTEEPAEDNNGPVPKYFADKKRHKEKKEKKEKKKGLPKVKSIPKRLKGASLANPRQKARKIKELEFEDN